MSGAPGEGAAAKAAESTTDSGLGTGAPDGQRTKRPAGVRIFSSAPDAPRSRRPTDGVLLAVAILGGVVLSLYAPGPTTIDRAATDLVA